MDRSEANSLEQADRAWARRDRQAWERVADHLESLTDADAENITMEAEQDLHDEFMEALLP